MIVLVVGGDEGDIIVLAVGVGIENGGWVHVVRYSGITPRAQPREGYLGEWAARLCLRLKRRAKRLHSKLVSFARALVNGQCWSVRAQLVLRPWPILLVFSPPKDWVPASGSEGFCKRHLAGKRLAPKSKLQLDNFDTSVEGTQNYNF